MAAGWSYRISCLPLVSGERTLGALGITMPLFAEEGIGSLAFIPLVTRGRLIGKFMVYYRLPGLAGAVPPFPAANGVTSAVGRPRGFR